QMECQRRIGHGRLSEIFGAAARPQDRFLRTVGFGRAAPRAWYHLSAEARGDTNAYIAGVNAFLATHHGRQLPPEFTLLQFEPEPWTGPDVMAWVKMMAWDLGANYSLELLRHDLRARVGAERAAQLMPPYPSDAPTIVGAASGAPAVPAPAAPTPAETAPASSESSGKAPGADHPHDDAARAAGSWMARLTAALSVGHPAVTRFLLNSAETEAVGSNNWVVDGTRTASGKPLLANDPHLGANIPSLWYLAHLSAGVFEVIGATLPGAPAVAIGRNRHIAWGETNVAADVQDLYLERLNGAGTAAEYDGQWEPLFVVKETIQVKGSDAVVLDVRISRHGPIVSDAINAMSTGEDAATPLPPLAFRWAALDDQDTTLESFLRLNEARNWNDFVDAMRLFTTPSQNFVYADVDGHIGYLLPGRIPIRRAGDGAAPVPGWTGEYEWTGWVPFDALPRIFDPPSHAIVTANHRPNPQSDPLQISLEYPEPYRAQQITALLGDRRDLTPDDFRRMQADTHSRHAATLLPLLLRTVDATDPDDRAAVDLLRRWNFDASRSSAAAAIFEAWFLQLAPVIVGDDLGPRLLGSYQGRYSFVTRFLTATLRSNDGAWCDDIRTGEAESCRAAVTRALHDAVIALRQRLGGDLREWTWGEVHPAVFPHQGLDAVAALRPLLNRQVPNGGDWSTVNVGAVAANRAYEQREIPGYRQIVDLSPANDSRFLDAVGQSGHFLSPRYDDFLPSFQTVDHRPMRLERARIDADAIGRLRLRPARRD
ncbi:MAG: penicillin acylase family protein, partial [Vicinamibacterales bacterium]